MIIKVIIILFSLFVLYRTVSRFRQRDITGRELAAWAVLWFLVIGATLVPQQTDVIAQAVGVERGADLLVYLSLVALFYIAFKTIVKLEKIDRDVTAVVRQGALNEQGNKLRK